MKSVNKLEDLLKATEQSINVIEICFEQLSEKYQNLRTKDKKFFELFQKKCTIKKNSTKNSTQLKSIMMNSLNLKKNITKVSRN